MKEGDVIFLSASVPYRDGWTKDAKPAEIEEAIVSLARAVFARKGRLLFGGHPSVSPLVAAVAGEYFPADPARQIRPIVTFQSRHFQGQLPDETTEMVRLGWSTIVWTPDIKDATPRESSLSVMRDLMLQGGGDAFKQNQLRPPVAMVGIGGMEGITDEALVFLTHRMKWDLRTRSRVYLFESGGGAAARLLHRAQHEKLWLDGRKPDGRLYEVLAAALDRADIVDVEAAWRAKHAKALPDGTSMEFQPYAAISQWLLDALVVEPAKA